MPPELLPDIPDLEYLGSLFNKRTEVEIKLRKAISLYLGVKNNWNPTKIAKDLIAGLKQRADRKGPEELFVGRTPQEVLNDLYTLDLKSVILAAWESFKPLFENNKSRFEMNMDTLNKARRVDAHTRPFTKEEGLEFENSYAWLLSRLKDLPN